MQGGRITRAALSKKVQEGKKRKEDAGGEMNDKGQSWAASGVEGEVR